MPHDVFVSYSSIDKAAAFAACATFEGAGIRCWIAPRDVAAGAEWAEEIIDAIETAKIMVLIFSSNSNESRQVRREIELAVSRGLTIMPLRLEQIEPTRSMAYYMAGVHWIDALTPPLEAHFRKMVEWMRPHLKDGPRPEPEPPPQPPPQAPTREAAPAPRRRGLLDRLFGAAPAEPEPTPQPAAATASVPPIPPAPPHAVNIDTMSSMFRTALSLQSQNRHAEAIETYRKLIGWIDGDPRPVCVEETVRSYFNTGNSQAALKRRADAIISFDTALSRAAGQDGEGIRETVARILFNKAHALDGLERKAEAIPLYDEIVARYGEDVDGMGRELAGRALFTKAVLLAAMGREDEAIAIYDRYLAKYGKDAEQQIYVAEAMFNIGAAHGIKGRNKEAIAAYDKMLGRFRGANEGAITEFVAASLYNKGNRLSAIGKYNEAIAVYDDVVMSFGSDPRMPVRIAKAMVNRGNQYHFQKKKAEANKAYQAVITRFTGSTDPEVLKQIEKARGMLA